MIVVDLLDETATAAFAARIAAMAAPADIIALKGDLGTGKTAFARAFIRACGNQTQSRAQPSRSCRSTIQARLRSGISICIGSAPLRRHGSWGSRKHSSQV